jgi:hypothetical protein
MIRERLRMPLNPVDRTLDVLDRLDDIIIVTPSHDTEPITELMYRLMMDRVDRENTLI